MTVQVERDFDLYRLGLGGKKTVGEIERLPFGFTQNSKEALKEQALAKLMLDL